MPGAIGAGVEIAATRSWRASVPTAEKGDLRRFGEDANDTVLHDRKDSMAAPTDGVCRIRGLNRLPSGKVEIIQSHRFFLGRSIEEARRLLPLVRIRIQSH